MLSGFYTAASGMLVQQRSLEVLTNNITNYKTPGFQAERLVSNTFDYEYAIRKDAYLNHTRIGPSSPTRIVEDILIDINSGMMEETNRSLDVGIDGQGFFNIQGDGGENVYLTRNGKFDLDQEGYLILSGVGRVMGENGPIQVESSDITITTDGQVLAADGTEVDRLLITWPDLEQIEKFTTGLFQLTEDGENTPLGSARLAQGCLESSNIDINREYTLVMEAQRALQACSTAIKVIDSINQRAASQIAAL